VRIPGEGERDYSIELILKNSLDQAMTYSHEK